VTLLLHGHVVQTRACGLRDHWRVLCDQRSVGLIARDPAGYHTLPKRRPGEATAPPVLHAPTERLALQTLLAETIERA